MLLLQERRYTSLTLWDLLSLADDDGDGNSGRGGGEDEAAMAALSGPYCPSSAPVRL